jgi:hypothetical protein
VWCFVFMVSLLVPTVVGARILDGRIVVQRIGRDTGSGMAAEIAKRVRVVPFSTHFDPRTTPILLRGGTLFLHPDGTLGELAGDGTLGRLDPRHADALRAAYHSGHTIVIPDASFHDVDALHSLLGVDVTGRSSTHYALHAYTLRYEHDVPTARTLLYPTLSSRGENPDYDALAAARAVDIVAMDLSRPPAPARPSGSGPLTDGSIDWTDKPTMTTYLMINGSDGVFTTTVSVYALHACDPNISGEPTPAGEDHYVVTALADWVATHAGFRSFSVVDGTLTLDDDDNLILHYPGHTDRTYCVGGVDGTSAGLCKYENYPEYYELTIAPPATPGLIQLNAAPGGTQGVASSYSSGFAFGISGGVSISAQGPGVSGQAGATWSNTTTTTVPELLVDLFRVPDNGPGARWEFRYCTSGGSQSSECISTIQMANNGCREYKVGDPQHGQTPGGTFTNAVQSVHWKTTPDTRVGRTFDINVTFTAHMATSQTNLWWGPFPSGTGRFGKETGSCNPFYCNCGIGPGRRTHTVNHTFHVPYPRLLCATAPPAS